MLDPKMRADLDQAQAALVESVPPMLWGLFLEYRRVGFTEAQAMDLVKTQLAAMSRPVER